MGKFRHVQQKISRTATIEIRRCCIAHDKESRYNNEIHKSSISRKQ